MCDCPEAKENEFSRNWKETSVTAHRIRRCEVVEGGMGQTKLSLVGQFKGFGLCPLDNGEPLKEFKQGVSDKMESVFRSFILAASGIDEKRARRPGHQLGCCCIVGENGWQRELRVVSVHLE